MSEWFGIVVQSPRPQQRVRKLSDGHLSAAIEEIEEIPEPNAFHAEVYALLMREALLRWRGLVGMGPRRHGPDGTADSR